MHTFLALYRGNTIGQAKLIAVTAEPTMVANITAQILKEPSQDDDDDLVISSIEQGRRRALREVLREVQ